MGNQILGANGAPLKKGSNFIGNWWRWFATSMRGGIEAPASTLVGTFAIWCLALGGISLLAGASYLALGKSHETHPILPGANPTDAGESFAARLIKPLWRSSTAPSSEGKAIQPTEPDDEGLYRNGDAPQ